MHNGEIRFKEQWAGNFARDEFRYTFPPVCINAIANHPVVPGYIILIASRLARIKRARCFNKSKFTHAAVIHNRGPLWPPRN